MSATTIIVNDVEPRRQYTASGGQTVFDFPIPFFATGDLTVWLTPTGQSADDTADLLTITTDYTVTGENTQDGGQITLVTPATAGDIITIERIVDIERLADFQNSGDLLAETLNKEQDTEIFIAQQLRQQISRVLKKSITSTSSADLTIPEPEALKILRWKSDLTGLENTSGDSVFNGDSGDILYTPPGAGAISRTVEAKLSERVSVTDFGADPAGVTDSTTEIQSAIDSLDATGGIVFFPKGTYLISAQLKVQRPGVILVGEGVSGASNSTIGIADVRANAATRIVWDSGASTTIPMILFEPAITAQIGYAGGLRDIVVDGNAVADRGVEFSTWFHADTENLLTLETVWAGLSLKSRDVSGVTLGLWSGAGSYSANNIVTGSDGKYYFAKQAGGEAEDPTTDTDNTYWDLAAEGSVFNTFRQYQHWSPSTNSKGVVFWRANAGSIGPNNNFFYQSNVKVKGGTIEAVSFQESDHNSFFGLHSNGGGPVFHADDTGDSITDKGADRAYARHNAIYYCNTGKGTAKATIAGSINSDFNIVDCAPGDGGSIRDWTIEDGAKLNLKHSFAVSGSDYFGEYSIGRAPTTARVKLTANESIAEDTDTPIPWDATDYEVTNVWAPANPTYFTVPQGVYAIKLTGQIHWAANASGNYRKVWVEENQGSSDEETGTATSVDAGTTLTDAGSDFTAAGVTVGDRVLNVADGSSASITAVGTTTVTHKALAGGSENDWDIGEAYRIIKFGTFNGQPENAVPAIAGAGSINICPITSGWIETQPGWKYMVMCRQDLGGGGALDITSGVRTWFHIECR